MGSKAVMVDDIAVWLTSIGVCVVLVKDGGFDGKEVACVTHFWDGFA